MPAILHRDHILDRADRHQVIIVAVDVDQLWWRFLRTVPVEASVHLHLDLLDRSFPRELLDQLGFDPDDDTLLGFYEGVPITERSDLAEFGGPIADTIYIYQEPLEKMCATRAELEEEIRRTIVHEVAHHFGFDEDEIDRLGFA